MTNACDMLTERCIRGITANVEHCEKTVRDCIGIVTAFSPRLGYEKASELAKRHSLPVVVSLTSFDKKVCSMMPRLITLWIPRT